MAHVPATHHPPPHTKTLHSSCRFLVLLCLICFSQATAQMTFSFSKYPCGQLKFFKFFDFFKKLKMPVPVPGHENKAFPRSYSWFLPLNHNKKMNSAKLWSPNPNRNIFGQQFLVEWKFFLYCSFLKNLKTRLFLINKKSGELVVLLSYMGHHFTNQITTFPRKLLA